MEFSAAIRAMPAGIESDPPRVFAEIPLMLDVRAPFDVDGTGARVLVLERSINQGAPLIVQTNWMRGPR